MLGSACGRPALKSIIQSRAPHPAPQVWALAVGGPGEGVVATGGGDGAVALWEDCTAQDAAAAAAEAQEAVLRQQELLNALQVGCAAQRWVGRVME